ncbi:hypothetical protein KL931_005215 [Ogataea haglerorum]|nr:hypothetical protein KL931_005215 [Ogataea haglerorum]
MVGDAEPARLLLGERAKRIHRVELAEPRERRQPVEHVVQQERHHKAVDERQLVQVLGAGGDLDAGVARVDKAGHQRREANDPRRKRAPVEARAEPVDRPAAGLEHVHQLELALAHHPVVAHHDARRRAQQHRVRRHHVDEHVRRPGGSGTRSWLIHRVARTPAPLLFTSNAFLSLTKLILKVTKQLFTDRADMIAIRKASCRYAAENFARLADAHPNNIFSAMANHELLLEVDVGGT